MGFRIDGGKFYDPLTRAALVRGSTSILARAVAAQLRHSPAAAGQLSFVNPSYTGFEGTVLQFSVARTVGANGTIAVDWSIQGLTEGAPIPPGNSGTISWNNAEAGAKLVSIQLGLVTATRTGSIVLSNPRSLSGGLAPTINGGSATLQVTNDTTAPGAVTINATPFSTTQINLSFSGGADSQSGFREYAIRRATSAGGPFNEIVTPRPTAAGSFSDTGRSPATTYFYRADAIDVAGNTTQSSVVSATTPASGVVNRSLRFIAPADNDTGRVKFLANTSAIPMNSVLDSNQLSVRFWMRATAANTRPLVSGGNNNNWILGNILIDRDRFNQNRAWGISLVGGRICFGLWDSNGDMLTVVGTTDLRDDQWHYICIERDRVTGAIRVFVDNTRQVNVTSGPTGLISYPNGGVPQSGFEFSDPFSVDGAEKHDLASDFDGHLTEREYAQTFRHGNVSTITRPTAPFVADVNTRALHHFNESSGNDILDEIGNASPGVIIVNGSGTSPVRSSSSPFGLLVAEGQTFRLNGAFTAKASGANPLVYDEFETGALNGQVNNNPATIGEWRSETGSTPGSQSLVTRSNTRAFKGTRSARCEHTPGNFGNASLYRDRVGGSLDWVFDLWMYVQPFQQDGRRSRNHKIWRMYNVGGNGLDGDQEAGNEVYYGNPRGALFMDPGGGEYQDEPTGNFFVPYNQWFHLEVEVRCNTTQGRLRAYHDCVRHIQRLSGNIGSGAPRIGVRLANYWGTEASFGGEGNQPSNTGAYTFIDCAYIDRTLQRVVIGNAATWDACTRRAPQPATAWSTGEIECRGNLAGLSPSDSHWAYALGPNGSFSAPELIQAVTVSF